MFNRDEKHYSLFLMDKEGSFEAFGLIIEASSTQTVAPNRVLSRPKQEVIFDFGTTQRQVARDRAGVVGVIHSKNGESLIRRARLHRQTTALLNPYRAQWPKIKVFILFIGHRAALSATQEPHIPCTRGLCTHGPCLPFPHDYPWIQESAVA